MIKWPVSTGIRHWLKANWRILFLSFLASCLSLPAYELVYLPGLDGPLPWLFNFAAEGNYSLFQHSIFPHGPLAFLLYPLPTGNNLWAAIFITMVVSTVLSMHVFKLSESAAINGHVVPFVFSLIILSLCEIQLFIFVCALLSLHFFMEDQRKFRLWMAVILSVLALLIKSYAGILCSLVIFTQMIYFISHMQWKLASRLIFAWLLVYFTARLLLFQGFAGSLDFLRGQWELAVNNSESTAFYQGNRWDFIFLSLTALIVTPFLTDEKKCRDLSLLFALPFFAGWKHAMTRADNGHFPGFLVLMMIFYLLLWLMATKNRMRLLIAGTTAISAFVLDMAFTAEDNAFDTERRTAMFRPYNLFRFICDYDSVTARAKRTSAHFIEGDQLPMGIRAVIGDNSADVYPWNYSIVPANNLNWKPRPILCSYAAYTSWLDGRDAAHFRSGAAPEFLVWDIDELGGRLAGIDYRYLLNDEPRTMIELLKNYKRIYKDKKWLVLKRRNLPLITKSQKISEMTIPYEKWIDVPVHDLWGVLRVKAGISRNFTGRMKGLFYKGEAFSILYRLSNGREFAHKMVPGNAVDGLWIDPMIVEPQNATIEPAVRQIKFVCEEPGLVNNEVKISFHETLFSNGVTLVNPGTFFFGKILNKRDKTP